MIDAMVKDTGAFLQEIQSKRSHIEGLISEGKADESIAPCTAELAKVIKDYKVAAGHVKKHIPKKAKEPAAAAAPPAANTD